MIEKVNPSHPDKVADRIAGAIGFYDVCRYAHKFDIESMTPTALPKECDPYIKDNGGIYEN